MALSAREIAYFQSEIERLNRDIKDMESGRITTATRDGNEVIDTTAGFVESYKRSVAEIQKIIDRHPAGS